MQVKVKKLNENAVLPTHGSEDAAGWDLYTLDGFSVKPYSTEKVGTGLAFELPKDTFAAIFARSGLAADVGLRPANCVGVCDADYRGEYIVAIHNDGGQTVHIGPGERIAQMVLLPFIPMELEEVDELSDTVRGEGGFGSTGVD